ncbi:MAG: hypothetical protein KAI24_04865, partial [Planctomycetes bacterium]|nr:hypothetical protein [Planctomycetota bacterium]
QGFHRYTWDLRREGVDGRSRGPMVLPGEYELRLVHDGGESAQRVTLSLDPRVKAEGITADDLRAQAELILQVQELSQRATKLAGEVRRLSRAQMSEERGRKLDAIAARLNNDRVTYPQQMLLSQIRYLAGMIDRADQRPGNHAFQRYQQLVAEVAELERELEQISGR